MRAILASGWAVVCVASLSAQRPTIRQPLRASSSIEEVRRATVKIEVAGPQGRASGSGFVVAADGIIATAAHVITGVASATVHLASGEAFEVQGILVADTLRDFALMKVAGFGLPMVQFGNSDSVDVGQRLLAFGAPLGLEATVSDGLLSSVRLMDGVRRFQISVPVSPGSSGGPVTTEDGRVIGVVVSGIRGGGAENLNFALPINYVRGQLSLASGRAPAPLSQLPPRAQGPPVLPAASAAEGIRTVNDSLQLDWTVLDGVTAYSEDNDHTRTLGVVTQYRKTEDVNGRPVLERHETSIWNQDYKDRFRDEDRTVVSLDGNFHHYSQRTGLDGATPGGSYDFAVENGEWRFRSDGRLFGSSRLPAGVLPVWLSGAALAALPESLPPSAHIWFVQWDTAFVARAVAVRFDFGQRSLLEVPVATRGQPCGPTTRVSRRMLPVVWVTRTAEAERSVSPVLASRPHLRVDPQNTKCVSAPPLQTAP